MTDKKEKKRNNKEQSDKEKNEKLEAFERASNSWFYYEKPIRLVKEEEE